MAKAKIGVWGDSITRGAWDRELGGRVGRLRKYFDTKTPAFIYNLGITSQTTDDVLQRFKIESQARNINVVIFAIGNNDCLYTEGGANKTPLAKFASNIAELIGLAKICTDKIVFVGLSRVDESKTMPWKSAEGEYRDNANLKRYSDELQKICLEQEISFIDIFDLLDVNELPDGLHPNEQGHEKIYIKVRDFLLDNGLA